MLTAKKSVAVLSTSLTLSLNNIYKLLSSSITSIGKSLEWRQELEEQCRQNNLDINTVLNYILNDFLYEGFYIKTETSTHVSGRYKWIRKSFMDKILSSEHWKNRSLLKNQVRT